jgi:hypothetical protein
MRDLACLGNSASALIGRLQVQPAPN